MKYKVSVLLIAIGLVIQSCSTFVEDQNISPNSPSDAPLALVLSALEVGTFSHYTGNLARTSGILAQHLTGTQFQAQETNQYDINEQSFGNEFESLYSGGMAEAKIIIKKATSDNEKSPHYAGIARVLLAMNLALATDLFGDIPYIEAFEGIAKENPKFDTQESIYEQIQIELDKAIIELQTPASANIFLPGFDDFIFEGDVELWEMTAWALKARFGNRLSETGSGPSDQDILTWIDNAGLGDDFVTPAVFGGTGSDQNQWWAFENQRKGYIYMSKSFVDLLTNLNDPRISIYVAKDKNGNYTGTPIDAVTESSYVGVKFAAIDASLPLVSSWELKFIEAETALRAGQTARAQSAFSDAITSSLEFSGVSDSDQADYLAANGTLNSGTELEQIMTQKYIGMFTQIEPYNDFRRTGFPQLTPNPKGIVNYIPLRFPIAQSERLYNSSSAGQIKTTDVPVWWDK